jgi:beta-barrel assembly-enhancing protease
MKLEWKGYHLDGRSAARQPAVIRLMKTGLEVTTEAGQTFWWPYHEIRQTQGSYKGEQVRLERGEAIPEALVVSDPAFLTHLHEVAPEVGSRFHNPARRSMRIRLTVYAAFGAVGLTAILYLWGIPAMAIAIAPFVPAAWEDHLGGEMVKQIAPSETRCTDPERLEMLYKIVDTLIAPFPDQPYTFRIVVLNDPTVNALAAPGGHVIILRGLMELTQSAEEMAGILAHELQHILKQHTTKALLQDASTGILLAALAGDVSGALTFALESARTLGMLRYSRQYEDESDLEGMQMLLAAKIDPNGMVTIFEKLEEEGLKTPDFLKYLSTHPATDDRIEKLRALARTSEHTPVKLLPDYEWTDIHKMCPASAE